MEGERRPAWISVVALVICLMLLTLAGLSWKQPFMILVDVPGYGKVTSGSVQDIYNTVRSSERDGLKNKVTATLAGIVLMFIFAGIALLVTLLSFLLPYEQIRVLLTLVPPLTMIGGIVSTVGGISLFTEYYDQFAVQVFGSPSPHAGFICCVLQSVFAFIFLCSNCFCTFEPSRNSVPSTDSLRSGYRRI
eukprot:TRINITY_DN4958_c1_g1_i1.p1 TRINITY_DN4958_c1_g1~~TRINITY_DN4958_c1_g1_i1.p1  ORF type:complete len:191 (+),score=22.42 TRINITY_DN4958_c1_g1_i1:63-635(+)